ncbi:S8 family peptidase [Galbibacter sp. EGI 63066]|uniref:S8 family peptidase n=1 Tax=Galbibacter sp. EGI 63066 TaxID=2993559 RepID=UPI002249434F|nr:S8 family peptidase [Galbibacter sp. EGI 63066]MCX2678963.1 S8 family peptidase [Galbibacter sp. EGI 63066]
MKKCNLKHYALLGAAALMIVSCSKDEENINTPESVQESDLVTQQSQVVEGQYIVVFSSKVSEEIGQKSGDNYAAAKMASQSEAERMFSDNEIVGAEVYQTYGKAIKGVAVKLSKADADKLALDERVKYVEQDRIVALAPPPGKGNGGGGGTMPQETPYGITRVNGVADYTGTGVAWVIDTGIDLDHPDLNVDASRGFNAFTKGRDAGEPDDGNGHGSHVAGTIAAINNDIGVIGVAPGATVIPVKVLDSRGSGSYSGVIAGVDHVGANGSAGDVANMSLGGPVSQALDDAVVAASNNGIEFALAAGNESDDANNHSPARANGSNIYTISAMDSNDDWAYFSNFGNPPVDFCAPGVSITSTWKDGGYNTISGTSMASPHAAGVLLLGNASSDGTVNGDPDGNSDAIIVY